MAKSATRLKVNKAGAAQRVRAIMPILARRYPDARIALDYGTPLELLIATILSAQCTDVRVNMVTETLFRKYKSAQDWIDAPISQIEEDIRSTGFFRNKAANIKGACKMIVEEFGGRVPDNMDDLLKLPGVGRKTANVILGNVFGKPGIVCDTHVIRLSRRLALSENTDDPVKLEFDLNELVPEKKRLLFSDLLIFHGRNVCIARKPDCPRCPIAEHCPAADKPQLW
jgi:endonuclease-3